MNNDDLSQLLPKRRRELGISQRDLSEIAGVSLHTLSDLESGKGNPTVSTLDQVLTALGLELVIQLRTMR